MFLTYLSYHKYCVVFNFRFAFSFQTSTFQDVTCFCHLPVIKKLTLTEFSGEYSSTEELERIKKC